MRVRDAVSEPLCFLSVFRVIEAYAVLNKLALLPIVLLPRGTTPNMKVWTSTQRD